MESIISRLLLISGSDLQLTPAVTVKHPTVADILSINNGFLCEDYYWAYVSSILSDPYDYMVFLDDRKIDYETVDAFTVFTLRWAESKQEHIKKGEAASDFTFMQDALAFYFGPRLYDITMIQGQPVLIDHNDPYWCINGEMFNLVSDFITKMNCLERTDKIRPANKAAKKILIDDARAEQKRKLRDKKKPEHANHIGDALAFVYAGNGTVDGTGMHIYQLLTVSRALQKKLVVQAMLNGIYTGMLKADKISDDELRWA